MPIGITTEIFKKSYWNYFLELEEEFLLTQKYVTFDKLNFNTFSAEYIKLIQAVCSEIDVVAKEIASYFNSSFEDEKNPNIQRWGFVIQSGLPEICTHSVVFSDEVLVSPWKNFGYERYTAKNNSARYKLKKGAAHLAGGKTITI